jgi:hypothetical protein
MKFGFSGHQNAPEAALDRLGEAVAALLREHPGAWGLSSLAVGSDQTFAEAVRRAGGELHTVLPSNNYETTFGDEDRERYERLLQASASVTTLPFPTPSEEAFLAAGIVVAERCDTLIAVWDGQPAGGLGGTADVVAYAGQIGTEVKIVWPDGLRR